MTRMNKINSEETRFFIAASLVPTALFVATLIAAVQFSAIERAGHDAGYAGFPVMTAATA